MRGIVTGIVDADPVLVGLVVIAVVLAAAIYVTRRLAGRRDGAG